MSGKQPNKPPKSPKICTMCTNTPKPSTGRILGYVGQRRIPRAPGPPATPRFFVVSNPQIRPRRCLDPRTSGHLVEPEGSTARTRLGQTMGPPWSPGRKKSFIPKLFPDHLGFSNKRLEHALSPWWRPMGHGIPKCLENQLFHDQKWVKNAFFQKSSWTIWDAQTCVFSPF